MIPALLVLLAIMVYALQNLVVEQKLSGVNIFALVLCLDLVVIPCCLLGLAFQKVTHRPVVWPSEKLLAIVFIGGILYFIADTCYLGSYSAGGNLMTATTIPLLLPVFACLFKNLWTGSGLPNAYQLLSYFLAALAAIVAVKGSAINH